MEGFDAQQIYSSGNLLGEPETGDKDRIDLHRIKLQFKEFIRQFHSDNFDYKYRYVYSHFWNLFLKFFITPEMPWSATTIYDNSTSKLT